MSVLTTVHYHLLILMAELRLVMTISVFFACVIMKQFHSKWLMSTACNTSEAVKVTMTLTVYSVASVTINILCNVTNRLTNKLHTLVFGHIRVRRAHDSWFETSDCNI
jgi:hypothetical protein